MMQSSNNWRSLIAELAVDHFLGHVENELVIHSFPFAQEAAKLGEKACIFTGAAPSDVVRRLTLREIRQLRRLLAVIKKLIEWALERARQFFQRFDGRYGMAVFYAGDITTEETGALLDVALGEFLFFAECAKTVTYNNADIIPCK